MTQARDIMLVPRSLPAERLDSYLRGCFPTISRGMFQRLIEEGHILVDGAAVKSTHHPRIGERIEIHWPEAKPSEAKPEEIPLRILFEDQDLLVLNKPPGLVVHPSAGHEEHTLVNALLYHCHGQLSGIGGVARPGIVHRLDKDTSGCLVVAKNDATHVALASQFARREIHKLYRALVCGQMTVMTGEIRASIARHPNHRKRMAVSEGSGREAWTSYRVLERLNAATLVEAELHTGRTHQIRVHLDHIGYPLVGDEVYGKRSNKTLADRTGYKAPRQMLHAWKLTLNHPQTGEEQTFEAPLPADFQDALTMLKENEG